MSQENDSPKADTHEEAKKAVVELLAELEHDQWMEWAKTLMEKEPGLTPERVARWKTYMVPYAELTEEVKEFDRIWARKAAERLHARGAYEYNMSLMQTERNTLSTLLDDISKDYRELESMYFADQQKMKREVDLLQKELAELKAAIKDLFTGQLDTSKLPSYFADNLVITRLPPKGVSDAV